MKLMIYLALFAMTTLVPASSLSFDAEGVKNRPVTKVVTLLKDMLKQLEKEAAEDQEIYDNMACWCTTNDKSKAGAISDAEDKIEVLSDQIEQLTAAAARLTNEIANLEKEIAANQAALDQATKVREKELASFTAEEKDLLESVSSLSAALEVLSKHNAGASLLQTPGKSMAAVGASLQQVMQKHGALLKGVLTHRERKAVASFLQAPQDYFDATPTFKQNYAAQSGEIFGILSQMKETFQSDLSSAQAQETTSQKTYEEVKKAKEEEIKAGEEQKASKEDELADTKTNLEAAKEDKKDTLKTLSADQAYLATLKEKCSLTDKEFEERLKTRQLEMEAVSKALAVLSGDAKMDLYTRTFQFMQEKSSVSSARRTEASRLLEDAAEKLHNPRLSTLAIKVRLDAFTKVKKAIDDMIAELLKQKENEIKKKDFCVDALNTNERDTQTNEQTKTDLETKIADLELKIKTLSEAIAKLKADIGDAFVQLKRATEDREKEAKEFQLTVKDQQDTTALLKQALEFLQSFYGKAASLAQKAEPAGPPPPPGFKEYVKNPAAAGVTGLIQQIIDDAVAMEAEAIKDETDAAKAYGDLVTQTTTSIDSMKKEIVDKTETKAIAEGELAETKKDHADTVATLEELATKKEDLHSECDYVMKNFDLRQTARDQEVEALKQAKAILSGAKFETFLQGR